MDIKQVLLPSQGYCSRWSSNSGRTASVYTQANAAKFSLQSFRTEKACVAAIKIPHSSAAILGNKFIAGRRLTKLVCSTSRCLQWSCLAQWRQAADEQGELAGPQRNTLKEGSAWRVCRTGVGPQSMGEKLQVDRNVVPGTCHKAASSCLQEISVLWASLMGGICPLAAPPFSMLPLSRTTESSPQH